MKKKVRITIDISMFLLFLYLLSYRPGMGLLYHALVGITQLLLFVLHHVLNLSWYKALLRGKYGFKRTLLTVSDFLLLIAMIFMMLSSLMISGMVFEFVSIQMTGIWRRIHVTSSAWCFILTAFHVGMHIQGTLLRIQRFFGRRNIPWLLTILETAAVLMSVYFFIQCGFTQRLTMARRIPQILYSDSQLFTIHLLLCIGMSVLIKWMFAVQTKSKPAKRPQGKG